MGGRDLQGAACGGVVLAGHLGQHVAEVGHEEGQRCRHERRGLPGGPVEGPASS